MTPEQEAAARWSEFEATCGTAGTGTPQARFVYLLRELDRRFPDHSPMATQPPEERYLDAIDAMLNTVKELTRQLDESNRVVLQYLRVHDPEELLRND